MTIVKCFRESCSFNHGYTCTRDLVVLYSSHSCGGGCDDGWEVDKDGKGDGKNEN